MTLAFLRKTLTPRERLAAQIMAALMSESGRPSLDMDAAEASELRAMMATTEKKAAHNSPEEHQARGLARILGGAA
ncbi:MAG: hypothetical protein KAH44_13640 [Oricola sp.]|nr:hypothetical protein [Oricola sp.]